MASVWVCCKPGAWSRLKLRVFFFRAALYVKLWYILGLYIGVIQGLYRVHIGIIGYILGLYGDNGKENGSYYLGLSHGRFCRLGEVRGPSCSGRKACPCLW